jgi:signal transduction histidine kinase
MVKMKISRRVSISFVMILLFFFVLSTVAFGIIVRRSYIAEAREDLKRESFYLANNSQLVAQILAGERKRIKRDPAELTLLLDSNLILVSERNRIMYSEDEAEAKALLMEVREGRKPDDLIFIRQPIETPVFSGTMVLYYRIEELQEALTMNRRAGIFGLLIALPFTLLIVWVLQRQISRPVQALKERMDDYSREKGMKGPVVESEDEMRVLSATFDALKDTIEENEKNRETLFANISHELKTPLMTIRGYAEGIQEGVIGQERGLETIVEETSRLNAFAQKVLALSKLSTQSLYLETVELGQLLQGTFQRYQPMVEQAGYQFVLKNAFDVKVQLDEERYRQAIGNLITNALRYAKTQVMLGGMMEKNRIGIYVEDDGEGVDEVKLESIFTRFEKGEHGQTGLGLAIVRRIMEQHGGTVAAENLDSGFRITLWFPKQ